MSKITDLINGFWMTQAVYVAAKLDLADRLAERPQTASELAEQTGVHGPSLYRLLRALASIGLFRESESGRFQITSECDELCTGHPQSKRAMAIMRGEWQYRAWGELLYSIRNGNSAFEHVFGQPMFDAIQADSEKGKLFDAAMTSIHGRETEQILTAYDFSRFRTVADIGGGNGSLLSAILRRYSQIRGTLFDLPGTIERARSVIAASEVGSRCDFAAGDFFAAVPSGSDAYLLRHILHDWDDDQCKTILGTCRAAMTPGSKLLIAEFVIPPGNEPFFGKWYDLAMLVGPGGRERTAEEYDELFRTSGFRLNRIVNTAGEISVVEGEPV